MISQNVGEQKILVNARQQQANDLEGALLG
jgi:hypothetical protein